MTQNQLNPKKFWNEIGKIWDKSKDNSQTEINLKDPADGLLKSGAQVGNIFNEYFTKVGENLQ